MTADERGDLAESLVPAASEFAFIVRTEGRDAIGRWLDEHGITGEPARALAVVLAAGWPIDATNDETLSWVTFDEHGEPLDGTLPLLPCLPVPADDEDEHGTYRRYKQHRRDGESNEDTEACGCAQAARDYRNERYAAQKAKIAGTGTEAATEAA